LDLLSFLLRKSLFIFLAKQYNYENFPHDEINTLPAFVNGSASASVSRGTTFGSFAGESSHGEGTKVLGRYCKLNFKLTKGRRPATSEVEALMNVTALFLDDQVSDAWTINYVDVELKDVFLPTRPLAGVALYDWSVSFNTQVWVKSSALQDRNDLADLMEGLDWQGDYRTNYATEAIVPSTKEGVEDWDIFATATQVTYEKASPPRPPGRGERQLRSYS